MGLIKDIKEIKKEVEKINKSIDSKVIDKARKYDELIKHLDNVVLNLKITQRINQLGDPEFTLHYSLPDITLYFDSNNELIYDPLFTAINMLNLNKIEDVNKIYDIIDKKNKKR